MRKVLTGLLLVPVLVVPGEIGARHMTGTASTGRVHQVTVPPADRFTPSRLPIRAGIPSAG